MVDQEKAGALRACIETLPIEFREVLVMRELEEMSYQEIADALGVARHVHEMRPQQRTNMVAEDVFGHFSLRRSRAQPGEVPGDRHHEQHRCRDRQPPPRQLRDRLGFLSPDSPQCVPD